MAQYQIDKHNSLFYNFFPPANSEGITWVFFNALTGDTQMWESNIAPLLRSKGNGTLSFNYRGQAASSFSQDMDLDSSLIVEDTINLLSELKPQRIILCGLSIGGLFAAQSWLTSIPDIETVGLVLINTLRKQGERLQWINDALVRCTEVGGLRLFRDLFLPLLFNEEWQGQNRQNFLLPEGYEPIEPDDGHYNLLKNAGSADWDQPYEDLKLPVLVITGLQDQVFFNKENVEQLYLRLPDARHIKFANAGHMIPAERPVELVDHLLTFASEVS